MKQTTKTLIGMLALLVVAGGIGGAALWTSKDEAKKAEEKEKSEKLFEFEKAKVTALTLEKDGKPVADLVHDKAWSITAPVKAEADDAAVGTLIDALVALKQKKQVEGVKDLAEFGLQAPKLKLTAKLDGGATHTVAFGVDNGFDNTTYALKDNDGVVRVVDGSQKTSLDKSLFDLRDKKVAHLDEGATVTGIEVSGAVKAPYALAKSGNDWKLRGGASADASLADRLATALKSLRATGVAAESASNPAEYGLDKPRAQVKLTFTPGKDTLSRTLLFGQPARPGGAVKTYAKREDAPTVYEVESSIVADLDKSEADLRDKQLVHVSRDEIRKLVLESPGNPKIEIAREKQQPADGGLADEAFTVLAPDKGPAKKWKLSGALYSVTGLRATELVPVPRDLKSVGLDKPKTVTLLGEGDKVLARVRIGAEKDGKRYALADGATELARVEKATVDDLPWTAADALEAPAPVASLPDGGVASAHK